MTSDNKWKIIWLVVAVLAGLGVASFVGTGLVDDTYIFCRYSDNFLNGQGWVFNPGEYVEGYTSPLHLWIVTFLGWIGIPTTIGVVIVSLGAALAICWFLASRFGGMAALFVGVSLPFVAWAGTGMDVLLFALLVLVATYKLGQLVDSPTNSEPLMAWLICGLPVLARPEGALILIVLFLVRLRYMWAARKSERIWFALALGLAPALVLTVFRVIYYGELLPNTFYAKAGGGGSDLLARGASDWLSSLLNQAPLVLAAIVGAVLYRRAIKKWPVELWVVLALSIASIVVGGDHFALHRFFVPLVPLLALLAWRGVSRVQGTVLVQSGVAVLVAGLCFAWPVFVIPADELTSFRNEVNHTRMFDAIGQEMRTRLGEDQSIGMLTIGAIPYRTGWPTVDMLGLVDKDVARLDVDLGQGVAGHEKFSPELFLDKEPSLVLLHPWPWKKPVEKETLVASKFVHPPQKALLEGERLWSEYSLVWVELSKGYLPLFVR